MSAARDTGMKQMLADIDREVEFTRDIIGKDALDSRVMDAMARVPRDAFVPQEIRSQAFRNGALPIGHGQTISQPYIVALMTDLLATGPDHVVLEVGTGTGYQAAVLSLLCRSVYSMDLVPALAVSARERLAGLGYDNVRVRAGNGYHGWPEHAPYDGILVAAAAPHIPPALVEQLRPGGRLVIPLGRPYSRQELMLVTRHDDGQTTRRPVLAVAFVPLLEHGPGEARESGS